MYPVWWLPVFTTPQPFTMDFPRTNIYELITPDLLHQLIKGTFKDHLIDWVGTYLTLRHGPSGGQSVLDEIDRRYESSVIELRPTDARLRISLAPPFPGLRRFKHGRNFKQWTGADSKGLMKVTYMLRRSRRSF